MGMPTPYSAWFEDGEFTSDWISFNFDVWAKLLEPLRGQPINILEVGSFEGRSAIFFLEYLPLSNIVCIDRFEDVGFPGYGERFQRNTGKYANRVEAIRAESIPALHGLLRGGRRFDLIFIDGCHVRDNVLIDSMLCWYLLGISGILIWDDYDLDIASYSGPRGGIDQALKIYEGELVELRKASQVIVRKTGESRAFKAIPPRAR